MPTDEHSAEYDRGTLRVEVWMLSIAMLAGGFAAFVLSPFAAPIGAFAGAGCRETKVELYVDEGENRILGVSGGYAENGEVLGGDTVIEATVTVEVKS